MSSYKDNSRSLHRFEPWGPLGKSKSSNPELLRPEDKRIPSTEKQASEEECALRNQWPALPPIAGIDPDQAALTFGNNGKFFLELLRMFLSRFGEAAHETRSDLARGDRDAAIRRLHALRGTAGNLGALELAESAHALEHVIADNHCDTESLLRQFTTQLVALADTARPWLRKQQTEMTSPETEQLDGALLEALRRALSCNDLSALDLFAKLESALAGAYGGETARTMSEAIQLLRFDEVLCSINKLREKKD